MQGHEFVVPSLQADGTPFLTRQPERAWRPLPVEGDWVPLTEYWVRRIRDRDVLIGTPPAAEAPAVPDGKAARAKS